eukprot:15332323-Ditylum_brightwellii.AAC.1
MEESLTSVKTLLAVDAATAVEGVCTLGWDENCVIFHKHSVVINVDHDKRKLEEEVAGTIS